MGGIFSLVQSLLGRGRGGGKEAIFLDPYTVFVENVVQAVDTGDLPRLCELQEESNMMLWGGVEAVPSKPPLIHRAAGRGYSGILKYLLDHGANPNVTDTCGMSVLHQTCKLRQSGQSCFQVVVGSVQDIDKRDVWGRTPLIKALVFRNTEIAMTLLHMGANPNAVDIYGITPLSTAVDYDLLDMVRALVRHGADINFMTQQYFRYAGPPLYLAVNNQNVAMTTELLRLGACTRPRPEYYVPRGGIGPLPWQYLAALTSANQNNNPYLEHRDAVGKAISELLKRGQDGERDQALEILQAVLSAHGHVLAPATEVLVRVLLNTCQDNFSLLFHKFLVFLDRCQDDRFFSYRDRDSNSERPQHLQQQNHHLNNNNNNNPESAQRARQPVTSLETQARRMVRSSVMRSGRNVVWATKRLHCPPRLKSLILLRDIDQAHGVASSKLIDDV